MQVGGAALAVVDKTDLGIQFGAEGLTIALAPDRPTMAKCRLGSYYAKLPNGTRSIFAEGESNKATELMELKVTFVPLVVFRRRRQKGVTKKRADTIGLF